MMQPWDTRVLWQRSEETVCRPLTRPFWSMCGGLLVEARCGRSKAVIILNSKGTEIALQSKRVWMPHFKQMIIKDQRPPLRCLSRRCANQIINFHWTHISKRFKRHSSGKITWYEGFATLLRRCLIAVFKPSSGAVQAASGQRERSGQAEHRLGGVRCTLPSSPPLCWCELPALPFKAHRSPSF